MKLYLAHNFAAGPELLATILPILTRLGHEVTSNWITQTVEGESQSADAVLCVNDVEAADAILYFIDDYESKVGRGKHFELGYALAAGKICFVVENGLESGGSGSQPVPTQKRMVFLAHPSIIDLRKLYAAKNQTGKFATMSELFDLMPYFLTTRDYVTMKRRNLNSYVAEVGAANERWWQTLDGQPAEIDGQIPAKLLLVHSEVSEAAEGHRKGLSDDKLPQYPMIVVELIDVVIRVLDLLFRLCKDKPYTPEQIYHAKMQYNRLRVDHTAKHRLADGGKKY